MSRKHNIQNQTEALSELSYMFFNDDIDPTFRVNLLDANQLNYSLESLQHVNEYLEAIRKEKFTNAEWIKTILRAGAYVGEVIRRNDKKPKWIWIAYEDAMKINPKTFELLTYTIATAAILYDGKEGFIFPLAKVEKYILNGSEDSVYFYAQVILRITN